MKVTKLKIDSMYGVKHLELDGRPIELRGVKGTGKTSVLDAIKLALTNRSDRDYIIKQGATEGEILIETDTGISVNRKKRAEGSDFTKVTEYGKAVQSPQSFLNDIFTPLQLNPVEFASWDKNSQNRAILDLIEFPWDMDWIKEQFGEIPRGVNYQQHILQVLEDIQAKDGAYWKEREDVNRRELYKRQSAAEIAQKIPQGYSLAKWESYSLSERIKELQEIQQSNGLIERAKTYLADYDNKVRGLDATRQIAISSEKDAISAEREGLKSTIERLKAEIRAHEETLRTLDDKLADKIAVADAEYEREVAKLGAGLEKAQKYAALENRDTAALQDEISTAEQMKSFISEYKSWQTMLSECKELKERSEQLTEKIQLARELPGKVLESSTIPVDGLTVKNGIPLIHDLPISNLSGGERIELCVDITLSKPQKLQMILIDGAEALDDASRERLYAKCKSKGLQVIAARTTNDNEFTVVEL